MVLMMSLTHNIMVASRSSSLPSSPSNGVVFESWPIGVPEALDPLTEFKIILHLAPYQGFHWNGSVDPMALEKILQNLRSPERRFS